jgi:putative ubiquitin-RnfH superfamily antitoxin RatB of RatAB toxin-antitoxin module
MNNNSIKINSYFKNTMIQCFINIKEDIEIEKLPIGIFLKNLKKKKKGKKKKLL